MSEFLLYSTIIALALIACLYIKYKFKRKKFVNLLDTSSSQTYTTYRYKKNRRY